MSEKPIIFSADSVRAILDGHKTMTRRVCGLERINEHPDWHSKAIQLKDGTWSFWYSDRPGLEEFAREKAYPKGGGFKCPYGEPGDRLWVREAWRPCGPWELRGKCIQFQADNVLWPVPQAPDLKFKMEDFKRWRPSIHMPRWASRITLEVTDVRVERVQDISDEDCSAEGIPDCIHPNEPMECSVCTARNKLCVIGFEGLWNSINAKRSYGWELNPWVWVIEFKRMEGKSR